jgi:hypothetical protein
MGREMSKIMPNVALSIYPQMIHLGSKTQSQIELEADNIVHNISSSNLFRSFPVNLRLLEYCNSKFSEKQVSRIDENFHQYSLGTKFPLNVPLRNVPAGVSCLVKKFFSGDVSGDIGEALFAYFLLIEMKIESYRIAHTRPGKRGAFLVPDFLIWDDSFKLRTLVGTNQYPSPLLAEVKGFTGSLDVVRVSHALEQLKTLILNSQYLGMVFLAVRNESQQRYNAYVLQVGS